MGVRQKNDGDPRASLGTPPRASNRFFATGEARNFKFGVRIDLVKYQLTGDKKCPFKGERSGSRGRFFNFIPPSVNLERVKLS